MRAMKDKIPSIARLHVGLSTGWVGAKNQIVLVVDFKNKQDFEAYMKHPYHTDYIDKTGDMYFDRDSFVAAQFEFEE